MYTIHFDVGSNRYVLNENNVDLIRQYFHYHNILGIIIYKIIDLNAIKKNSIYNQ